MKIVPSTKLGRLSIYLMGVFFVSVIFIQIMVALGQEGGETFFDNLLISLPALVGVVCAISAGFAGLASIVKQKERAILIFPISLIGLLMILFLIGEFTLPH